MILARVYRLHEVLLIRHKVINCRKLTRLTAIKFQGRFLSLVARVKKEGVGKLRFSPRSLGIWVSRLQSSLPSITGHCTPQKYKGVHLSPDFMEP